MGECDCESGSTKRICACVVAMSPLLLLVHLNRQRFGSGGGGGGGGELHPGYKCDQTQLGGATPHRAH